MEEEGYDDRSIGRERERERERNERRKKLVGQFFYSMIVLGFVITGKIQVVTHPMKVIFLS
jgi:hypothetical protein